MRTKGRKPLSVLRLKIFEKVFSENYETLFFRGPARTGQDRPGPARTGQDRPGPALVSVPENFWVKVGKNGIGQKNFNPELRNK